MKKKMSRNISTVFIQDLSTAFPVAFHDFPQKHNAATPVRYGRQRAWLACRAPLLPWFHGQGQMLKLTWMLSEIADVFFFLFRQTRVILVATVPMWSRYTALTRMLHVPAKCTVCRACKISSSEEPWKKKLYIVIFILCQQLSHNT